MVDKSVVALFEEQVKKFPFSMAVIEGDVSITYRDLNKSANQLAHYLISRGVVSETIIAISAERSISLIIGMLAILKAGGCYCALDPSYPMERIKYMLQDTGAAVILTQSQYLEHLPITDAIIICLDDLPPTVELNPILNPIVSIEPQHLAYIMYTSGSSGMPKGVMIEHKSIVNLVSEQEYIKFLPDFSIMHFSNISFDISTFEVWGSLLNGCQLIVVEIEALNDLNAFKKIIRQNPNPVIITSTAQFEECVVTMPDFYMGCRFVIFGGEICNSKVINDYINQPNSEYLPDTLLNAYGPTEATTLVTYYQVNRGMEYTNVPIGKPILNVLVEVLDNELKMITKGEVGEIWIAGKSIARGYLNRVALTQEKFVEIRGERFYRTGDLGRVLDDDNIEFQGRLDNQIKFNGYRIELEEIEATLWSFSDVENAVVKVDTGPQGEKSLTAYVTLHRHLIRVIYEGNAEIKWQDGFSQLVEVADISQGGLCLLNVKRLCKVHELIQIKLNLHNTPTEIMGEVAWQSDTLVGVHFFDAHQTVTDYIDSYYEKKCSIIPQRRNLKVVLEKKLPKYMVPDRVIVLSTLPFTTNGKIDRNALDSIEIQPRKESAVKTTESEEILIQLWRDVLSISKINVNDDFFTLGGDSLLVTRVLSKLRDHYNINITYDQFFENPSISALAAFVGNQIQTSHFNPIPVISRHQNLKLSVSQKRIWFLAQFFADTPLFNQSHYSIFEGSFDTDLFTEAVRLLLKRHEILNICFSVNEHGVPFQRLDELTTLPIEISNEILDTQNHDDAIKKHIECEANKGFDLNVAPLFRMLVMPISDNKTGVISTFHKIICDSFSVEVFYRDLLEIYLSKLEKREAELPPLPIQYIDFAYWQNAEYTTQNRNYHLLVQFWRNHLQGAPQSVDLPFDHSRADNPNFKVHHSNFVLTEELLDPLRLLSTETGSTLYMTLYSSFVCLIFMLTGKRDVVLGLPIANRSQSETENILGPFENLLAVRTSFSPTTNVKEFLDETKLTLLNCYQYQDIRFEKLLEMVDIPTQFNQHPLFQIVFSYLNHNDLKSNKNSILKLKDESIANVYSLFNLEMRLEERDKHIIVTVLYSTELFELATIRNWCDLWKILLAELPKHPGATLQDLSGLCIGLFDKSIIVSHESKRIAHQQSDLPQTKVEKILYQIWSDVLKRYDFNVNDSFFQLGGHSLQLIQMITRIKGATQKLIPVKVFFERPTIRALANYIESHSDVRKDEIRHEPYPSEIPLSFPQERLWYVDRLAPNNSVYNMPFVFKINGSFSIPRLKEAIDKIVERHEILRTLFFTNEEGVPFQKILPSLTVPIEIISTTEGPSDKVIETLASLPFDLEKAPLFRVTVFKYSIEDYYLIITFHQCIADLKSVSIFFNELKDLYGAPEIKHQSMLNPSLQYADFALYQRESFAENNPQFVSSMNFWKTYLRDAPSTHECPLDFERPMVHRFQGKRVYFSLPADISKKIKNMSIAGLGNEFSILLGLFYIFLNKISFQEDIVIATPVEDRTKEELSNVIGLFTNILPLRAKINPSITVMDFIYSVKDTTLKALEYQTVPYEKILTVTDVKRALNYEPLSQILFTLKNKLDPNLKLMHLKIEKEPFEFPVSKYDLTMSIEEREGYYKGYFEYDTQIFSEETIRQWKDRWLTLVQSAINEPEMPIFQLRILSAEEEQTILVDWNDTKREHETLTSFYDLFEDNVKHTPSSVAIELSNQYLSYQGLHQKVERLAAHLHQICPNVNPIIGILCDRSFELIISVLAIMRMGGAFIVLDPELPPQRLKYIIEDSKLNLILTKQPFIPIATTENNAILTLDSFFNDVQPEQAENYNVPKVGNGLAFIEYISSKSGKPKGIMIDEYALTDKLLWWKENIPLDPHDIFINLFTLSLDIGIGSLLWPLSCGASVIIPPYEALLNPEALADLILKKNVTVVVGTPSLLNVILNDARLKHSRLKKIIFAGENLTLTVLEKARRISNASIYNFYGPSECTIISSFSKIHPLQNYITIGRPVANVKIYILDRYLKPVPIGMIGEIYIGGVGISRGYVSQPRLTEASFVSSPFVIGEKLFQTGDRGLWRDNGEIEYKGRSDNQIKIRGFRVELDELDFVIRSVKGVQEVASIYEGNKIISFIMSTVPLSQIKSEISYLIPQYAMPDKMVSVTEIPLAENGKFNRKAMMKHASFQDIVHPRTSTEKQLADIFQEILRRDNLSVTDSFFELGGHSLLITQVLVKIEKVFNYSVTLQEFYLYPTIELLAKRIDSTFMPELSYTQSILSILERDIHLGDSIEIPPIQSDGTVIFMTGATGFLGSHIVRELVENSDTTIYYLVHDNSDSIKKSEKLIQQYKGRRLYPIVGDLNKPKLGIQSNIYELLSDSVSLIIHTAADTHPHYPYQQVRQTNVLGLVEILQLAANKKLKKIHFISNVSSCFDVNDKSETIEDFPKTYPTGTEGGYLISKWVSEKIFEAAVSRGFDITIYRPSVLLEDERTGEFNFDNNYLYLFVKGALQMGVAPMGFSSIDGLPVDFLAKLIVMIALSDKHRHRIYNLNHPHPISSDRIFEWLNELGAHLKYTPYTKWRDEILTKISKDNAFYSMLSLYLNMPRIAHVLTEGQSLCVNANTAQFMRSMSLQYPQLDIKHFAFLIQNALDSVKNEKHHD
jgi:amino acid adenylation domain-containing protein/thioester reductase-like protein